MILSGLRIFHSKVFSSESVSCIHRNRFSSSSIGKDTTPLNPCPVILVQDTSNTLSLLPDNLKISFSPPSVRLSHLDRFSTSRFGREFTPSSTPTPVMPECDKSNPLRLLLDLFSISIIPWFVSDLQLVRTSFSRLGRVLGRQLNKSPEDFILRIVIDLRLRLEIERKWREIDLRLILENIVNTISSLSSLLHSHQNSILTVSSSLCFSTKYLNTGPQPGGIRQKIFNSKKKTY